MPKFVKCELLPLHTCLNNLLCYYQKYVAIKSLKNTSLDGVLKGVLEEALTMQRLSHDYIVKMYGISLPCKEEPLKLVSMQTKYSQTCWQTPLESM